MLTLLSWTCERGRVRASSAREDAVVNQHENSPLPQRREEALRVRATQSAAWAPAPHPGTGATSVASAISRDSRLASRWAPALACSPQVSQSREPLLAERRAWAVASAGVALGPAGPAGSEGRCDGPLPVVPFDGEPGRGKARIWSRVSFGIEVSNGVMAGDGDAAGFTVFPECAISTVSWTAGVAVAVGRAALPPVVPW